MRTRSVMCRGNNNNNRSTKNLGQVKKKKKKKEEEVSHGHESCVRAWIAANASGASGAANPMDTGCGGRLPLGGVLVLVPRFPLSDDAVAEAASATIDCANFATETNSRTVPPPARLDEGDAAAAAAAVLDAIPPAPLRNDGEAAATPATGMVAGDATVEVSIRSAPVAATGTSDLCSGWSPVVSFRSESLLSSNTLLLLLLLLLAVAALAAALLDQGTVTGVNRDKTDFAGLGPEVG